MMRVPLEYKLNVRHGDYVWSGITGGGRLSLRANTEQQINAVS